MGDGLVPGALTSFAMMGEVIALIEQAYQLLLSKPININSIELFTYPKKYPNNNEVAAGHRG